MCEVSIQRFYTSMVMGVIVSKAPYNKKVPVLGPCWCLMSVFLQNRVLLNPVDQAS